MRYIEANNKPSLMEKILVFAGGSILLVVGLMFSAVLFVLVLVVGLIVWGYFWWKTRELRKVMREQAAAAGMTGKQGMQGGDVIEGEAVVVDEKDTRDLGGRG